MTASSKVTRVVGWISFGIGMVLATGLIAAMNGAFHIGDNLMMLAPIIALIAWGFIIVPVAIRFDWPLDWLD